MFVGRITVLKFGKPFEVFLSSISDQFCHFSQGNAVHRFDKRVSYWVISQTLREVIFPFQTREAQR